jgi:small conductance mechanosensitive channel
MNINIQVEEAVNLGVSALTHVAAAALTLLIGYVISVAVRRLTVRLLARPGTARALGPSIVRLLSSAIYYLLLVLAAAASLVVLGVAPGAVLTALAIVVIVLTVALQQSASNFAAPIIFLLFQPFKRGELVLTMGQMGTVEEILLFDTVLLLPDARLVSLPNSKVQESGVVNYSRMGRVRADFNLTVSYGQDVGQARAAIADIASADPRVLRDPPFEVVVEELGDNGVCPSVFPYVLPQDYWAVRNDLRERIKARFDAAGIHFALPQRHLRFSDAPAEMSSALRAADHTSTPAAEARSLM